MLLPRDPEIGSDGQRMVQITPRSQVQSLYGPFTEELDSVILVDPFPLRLCCDSVSQPECLLSGWRQQSGNCATVIKHLSCREAICQVIIRPLVTAQQHSEHSSGVKYVGKNQWSPWHKHTRSSPKALWASSPKRQGIGFGWGGRSGTTASVRNHLIQQPCMNCESYLHLRKQGKMTSTSYSLNLLSLEGWDDNLTCSLQKQNRRAPKLGAQKRFPVSFPLRNLSLWIIHLHKIQ